MLDLLFHKKSSRYLDEARSSWELRAPKVTTRDAHVSLPVQNSILLNIYPDGFVVLIPRTGSQEMLAEL